MLFVFIPEILKHRGRSDLLQPSLRNYHDYGAKIRKVHRRTARVFLKTLRHDVGFRMKMQRT
jgi:hypothetical protein